MGFHFHKNKSVITRVKDGISETKRNSNHVIDIPSEILVLAILILVGGILEYQGECLRMLLDFIAPFVSKTLANIWN